MAKPKSGELGAALMAPEVLSPRTPRKAASHSGKLLGALFFDQGASVVDFKKHVALAMRTSMMCVICSLPIFIPSWHDAILADATWGPYLGFIAGGTNLMIVFTVCADTGTTAMLFWQGAVGTAGACLWVTVMSALMPDGAAGDFYYAPLAHASNIIFMVLTMWLNISANVRMFILSYHVYFAMEFMNPLTPKGTYNTSWAYDPESEATVTMLTALAGLVGAIIVMLVPTPILAKRKAAAAATNAVEEVCDLMQELVDYYGRSGPSVVIAQKEIAAQQLRDKIDGMQGAIDASWWESFDIGGGLVRKLLGRHSDMLKGLCDNMQAVQICMAKEDFGKSHTDCMNKMHGPVATLLESTRELLVSSTSSAVDGVIDAGEKASLEASIGKTKEAVQDLGRAFNRTRRAMFPEKVINSDLQAESFFVYCLSAYARSITEYTFLMINQAPKKSSLQGELWNAGLGIFDADVLRSRMNVRSFTVRGSVTMLACYYIGMYGVGFNAVASGTVALLLSDFSGSALQKNMGRIQAVVIGAVVPHILYMLMGTACSPHLIVVRMVVLFLFETVCIYIAGASSSFGYIGCLAGAFALTSLIYPCGATPTAADEQTYGVASFVRMTQTTIGVLIMTVIDMALSSARASDGAQVNLLRGLMYIDAWFQAAFLQRSPDGTLGPKEMSKMKCRADIIDVAGGHELSKDAVQSIHGTRTKGTVLNIMNLAAMFGVEADKEPRYHRGAWPASFFSFQCRKALALRANLNMAESVLRGVKRSGATEYTEFAVIRAKPAWQAVQNDVTDTMGTMIGMIQAILMNEFGTPLQQHIQDQLQNLEDADKIEKMPQLFSAINASGLRYPADAGDKAMDNDEICRLNVLLMLFESNVDTIAGMMKECLKMMPSKN